MELLAPWILLSLAAIAGGLFWGFVSAGKRIRNEHPLTATGAVGMVVAILASGFFAFTTSTYSVGIVALGLLSDNSNTMPQVLPYAIGLGVAGAVLSLLTGWLLTYTVRLLHAGHTVGKQTRLVG